jgi:hypothetical protein
MVVSIENTLSELTPCELVETHYGVEELYCLGLLVRHILQNVGSLLPEWKT